VVSGLFAVPQVFHDEDPIGDGLDDPARAKPSDLQLRAAARHAADQDIVSDTQLDGPVLRLRAVAVALLGAFRIGHLRDVTIQGVAGGRQLLPM
jgi:hypothetical protein